MTFADYVREYELRRSEGLLLRYLSEAYRDEELLDIITFLRTTVRGVDSSLIDEWERMRDPAYQAAPTADSLAALGPPPLWADPRAFAARLRNELHALLVAVARKDWEAARAALSPGSEWTPARLEAELAPYFAVHPRMDTTPAARRPQNTFVKETGPRRWEAVQRIVDEAGEVDWAIVCEVDLSVPHDADRPVVDLVRVGT